MAEIRRLGSSFASFHGFHKNQETKSGIVTYTVEVRATPGGNRYYIDDKIVKMLYFFSGNTYTLDQSDSSNTGHPILYSTVKDGTNTFGGSVYTSGVTYFLNGSEVDQASYISNFDSATTRQVKIAVTDETPGVLYYYCWNHTGMAAESYVTMQTNDEDLLIYTVANLQDRNIPDIALTNGNVLDDPPNTDDRDDPTLAYPYRNLREREDGMTYEQWQIVQESVLYYLDNNGFLRTKYNENHEYGDPV